MTTIFDVPGSNPPNPFSAHIQALLTSTNLCSSPTPDETAVHIVATVTGSSNPAHTLWELWDAFFVAVATSSASYTSHFALLDVLRTQPPTEPNNVPAGSDAERQLSSYVQADGKLHWSALPRFAAQWRDVHDILKAWRDWDGVRVSSAQDSSTSSTLSNSGNVYYLRFCNFSAALLKATKGKGQVHPIWVFYTCRDVLERESPQTYQPKAHRMSPEQLWALDVRIAATWMRDGGRALWEVNQQDLRQHWAGVLDEKTEMWPREDGLTRERWQLWWERLRTLSTEGKWDEETRAVLAEATEVVEKILEGNQA